MNSMNDIFGPTIYSYTRANAIEEGALIDVTHNLPDATFSAGTSVVVTAHVWGDLEQFSAAGNWLSLDETIAAMIGDAFAAGMKDGTRPELTVFSFLGNSYQCAIGLDDDGRTPAVTLMAMSED